MTYILVSCSVIATDMASLTSCFPAVLTAVVDRHSRIFSDDCQAKAERRCGPRLVQNALRFRIFSHCVVHR